MLALMAGLLGSAVSALAATPSPWLFVSDIHLDPTGKYANGTAGQDTNPALLDATVAAMRRADPNPPVVVIDGDFLAHVFEARHAAPTMRALARTFDRAFPVAQFVLVMGNEDSDCGDYGIAPHAALFRAVAHAWEPLVNRHGAAPAFARTFPRDGFYVARLPVAGLRAVVVDDVFWSPRYRTSCGIADDESAVMTQELAHALPRDARSGAWIFAHIPPGVDAYSTVHIAHNLIAVPFLVPVPKDRFLALAGDRARAVRLVVTGHTHKFGFRLIPGSPRVPVLSIPSVSPIFRNAPAFLTVHVTSGGSVAAIDEWSLRAGRWSKLGDLTTLGMNDVSATSIDAMWTRFARDPALRERFANLYSAGGVPEIDGRNWAMYRCAATALSVTAFRACTATGGVSIVTRKGILAAAAIAVTVLMAAIAIAGVRLRQKRSAGRSGNTRT